LAVEEQFGAERGTVLRSRASGSGLWDVRDAAGIRFVNHSPGPKGLAAVAKRLLDIAGALVLGALAAPVVMAAAILIRLDSPGPVLVGQQRVGRNGRSFQMYKFRSMVAGADALQDSLAGLNEAQGALFKIRKDPRLTRVGRFLRRFSIDELPQLANVLKGEMSLVGPRPPFAHEVAQDHLRQAIRLRYPPGITGLWQVSGRSDLDYDQMIRIDLRYARTWSLLLDVAIMVRTIPAVLTGRGAC
jgi:lipopolysaccharide/colanic/teichoic acid biosynthesis glycosyltransferase